MRPAHDDLDNTLRPEAAAKEEVSRFQTLYEEYNMTLFRKNHDPMRFN